MWKWQLFQIWVGHFKNFQQLGMEIFKIFGTLIWKFSTFSNFLSWKYSNFFATLNWHFRRCYSRPSNNSLGTPLYIHRGGGGRDCRSFVPLPQRCYCPVIFKVKFNTNRWNLPNRTKSIWVIRLADYYRPIYVSLVKDCWFDLPENGKNNTLFDFNRMEITFRFISSGYCWKRL